MLAKQIAVGRRYIAKVSNKLTTVRVISMFPNYKGRTNYHVVNESTGRKTVFHSPAKFRRSVHDTPKPDYYDESTNPSNGWNAPEPTVQLHADVRDRLGRIPPYLIGYIKDKRFITGAGNPARAVQTINYSYLEDDGTEVIGIRTTPGDPCTMTTVSVADLYALQRQKRTYVHYILVSSRFPFPDDMLRYDDCQVCDEVEPAELIPGDPVIVAQVTIRATPRWALPRWASFSCAIKPLRTVRLDAANQYTQQPERTTP